MRVRLSALASELSIAVSAALAGLFWERHMPLPSPRRPSMALRVSCTTQGPPGAQYTHHTALCAYAASVRLMAAGADTYVHFPSRYPALAGAPLYEPSFSMPPPRQEQNAVVDILRFPACCRGTTPVRTAFWRQKHFCLI